jgi:NAD(P)H-dependent flavin oxidoreductase YrpB (nitropropane dioxygenase family)
VAVIRTPFTELMGVEHPVVCAGMGVGVTDGELAAAVSEAGGLGVIGASWVKRDEIRAMTERARELTEKPIGINLLLFGTEDVFDTVLELKPEVLSTAWERRDQELAAIFASAHDLDIKVMHMVSTLEGAKRAAEAGADVIVAQGAEGGGHVGEIATTVLVRQAAREIAPIPVLAAGGLADGAGLAAALALGAAGVLLGTRFLATEEAPVEDVYKQAIVRSDGYDTVQTTMPDTFTGRDWPGAWARVFRTPFIERWLGREPEVRRRRAELRAALTDGDLMWVGQSAGLVDDVRPAGDVVRQIVADAEQILQNDLPRLLSS